MKCVPSCTLTPAAERVHDEQELFKNGSLWVFLIKYVKNMSVFVLAAFSKHHFPEALSVSELGLS